MCIKGTQDNLRCISVGSEDLEAGEKPWINHPLYTNGFTKHFAVLLSQLCERSLAARVKLCGASEALDCQSVLKEIWKSNVSRLYTKKDSVIALHSDKRIYEVINGIEADVELFESMADKSSQKLAKSQQRERDKSLPSESMEEEKEQPSAEKLDDRRALKCARQDSGDSFFESSKSSLGPFIPQKIRLPEVPGMYYSHACTRQAITFPDNKLFDDVYLKIV